ncbi:MAG: DNA-processing protein DprA [Spirochaetes bacterium]|nr:DNA-processing protein DprA [Spirochaetota bacterium]
MGDRGLLDLIISRLPAVGHKDRLCLCKAFDAEADFARLSKGDVEALLGRRLKFFWDIDAIRRTAEADFKSCRARSIGWVSFMDGGYPPLLREIYDPPAVLFFRGRLAGQELALFGMVGTRRPSPQAASQAYSLARGLGELGISVVSGLALGVDALAHRGNVDGGAATYAVLGCGVDEVYPASNRHLAKRVLDSGGAILSEYPPGTLPHKWHFPARNRIISALSSGLFIAEAPARSGALITADFALDQGKDVFVSSAGVCIEKNSPYDRRGTVRLAQEGARIVYSLQGLLDFLPRGFERNGGVEAAKGAFSFAGGESFISNYKEE